MIWLIIFVAVAALVAFLCAGTVGNPILYGIFISAIFTGIAWAVITGIRDILNFLSGRRK